MDDEYYLRIALRLSERSLGLTAPNPSVGCVIVNNGIIVGRGWTAPSGRPHAETIALQQAGDKAKNAAVYVTLEPCAHHGKTPPCAEALIKAGIKRAVISIIDPDPRVSGKGIEILESAGIEVETGLMKKEAEIINKGFFLSVTEKRPLVTLKLATTIDGKISVPQGGGNWFTGEKARNYAHILRYRHDAIMVGVNTIISDNPQLTCRLPGLEKHSPVRVIMDNNLRTPDTSNVIISAGNTPTWLISRHLPTQTNLYRKAEILNAAPDNNGKINVKSALNKLAEKGITRLLVEGGGKLAESFLKSGYVDQLVWIQSKTAKGDPKSPDISAILSKYITQTIRAETRQLDDDLVAIYQFT